MQDKVEVSMTNLYTLYYTLDNIAHEKNMADKKWLAFSGDNLPMIEAGRPRSSNSSAPSIPYVINTWLYPWQLTWYEFSWDTEYDAKE